MGRTLTSHAYVNIINVGRNGSSLSNTLLCVTNLVGCCSSDYGPYRGNWYFPNGASVQPFRSDSYFYSLHANQTIYVFRLGAWPPYASGIYHCGIPDEANRYKTLYVGLYNDYEG